MDSAQHIGVDDLIGRHFDAACTIYQICEELSLPDSDARLYTYIHVKANEFGMRLDETWQSDYSTEIDALKTMLGAQTWENSTREDAPPKQRGVVDAIVGIADDTRKTESRLRDEHGMERRIDSELSVRLRFHTDSKFREEKLRVYANLIRPALAYR
jgi:hypothetical protein